MSYKYIVFVTVLSGTLISCGGGGGGGPEANSTNCSGAGMQSILPTFANEADRQAFIDKCQALAGK